MNSQPYASSRGTGDSLPPYVCMLNAHEYELKAENCATAALVAHDRDQSLSLLRQSVVWRNLALRLQLGKRAVLLNLCQFTDDQRMYS